MTSWKLDPAGIRTVLSLVDSGIDDLQLALADAEFTTMSDGLSWGGTDVHIAMATFMEQRGVQLSDINNRIQAGVFGVIAAANTYAAAQEDMELTTSEQAVLAEIQAETQFSASTGDLGYFGKY